MSAEEEARIKVLTTEWKQVRCPRLLFRLLMNNLRRVCIRLFCIEHLCDGNYCEHKSEVVWNIIISLLLYSFNGIACALLLHSSLSVAHFAIACTALVSLCLSLIIAASGLLLALNRRGRGLTYFLMILTKLMGAGAVFFLSVCQILLFALLFQSTESDNYRTAFVVVVWVSFILWAFPLIRGIALCVIVLLYDILRLILSCPCFKPHTILQHSLAANSLNVPAQHLLCTVCNRTISQPAVSSRCHPTRYLHEECYRTQLRTSFCCPQCTPTARPFNVFVINNVIVNITCGLFTRFKYSTYRTLIWAEGRIFAITRTHKLKEYLLLPKFHYVAKTAPVRSKLYGFFLRNAVHKNWIYVAFPYVGRDNYFDLLKYNIHTDRWFDLPRPSLCDTLQVQSHSLYAIGLINSDGIINVAKLDVLDEEQGWTVETQIRIHSLPSQTFDTFCFSSAPEELLFVGKNTGLMFVYDLHSKMKHAVDSTPICPFNCYMDIPSNAIPAKLGEDTLLYLPWTKECLHFISRYNF